MNTVELQYNNFTAWLMCSFFNGFCISKAVEGETLAIAQNNFRKLYKLLDAESKAKIRKEAAALKNDLKGEISKMIDLFEDMIDNANDFMKE